MATSRLHAELGKELELLKRVVGVSRQQHRRGIYYQRLRGATNRILAAHARCSPTAIVSPGGGLHGLAAIEDALNAVPAAWTPLRQLLVQTYFMPFALTCLALLSRSATVLAKLHAKLLVENPSHPRGAAAADSVVTRLLELGPAPPARGEALERVFRQGPAGTTSEDAHRLAEAPGLAAVWKLTDGLADDLGEPVDSSREGRSEALPPTGASSASPPPPASPASPASPAAAAAVDSNPFFIDCLPASYERAASPVVSDEARDGSAGRAAQPQSRGVACALSVATDGGPSEDAPPQLASASSHPSDSLRSEPATSAASGPAPRQRRRQRDSAREYHKLHARGSLLHAHIARRYLIAKPGGRRR
jgi:hypothetical protein